MWVSSVGHCLHPAVLNVFDRLSGMDVRVQRETIESMILTEDVPGVKVERWRSEEFDQDPAKLRRWLAQS